MITTRDFPYNSDAFIDIASTKLDDFVTSQRQLITAVDKKKYAQAYHGNLSSIEEAITYDVRRIFWKHDKALWKDTDYLKKGLCIRKTIVKNDGHEYLIYIAPCTSNNDRLSLKLKIEYTKVIIEIVKEDLSQMSCLDGSECFLIAHDSDVDIKSGTGIGPKIDMNFVTFKFQHEEDNPIWSTIIKPIRENLNNLFENCDRTYSLIGPLFELSKLNDPQNEESEDSVVINYKQC